MSLPKKLAPWIALSFIVAAGTLSLQRAQAGGDENETLFLSETRLKLNGPNASDAFRAVMDDLPRLLGRYRPVGAEIKNYSVTPNGPRGVPRVHFEAKKKVLVFVSRQTVNGDIRRLELKQQQCTRALEGSTHGIALEMDLRDSSVDITNNAKLFTVKICIREELDGGLTVAAQSFLKKGPDYGTIAGPMVRDLLRAQAKPLIESLREEHQARLDSLRSKR